MTVAALIVAAGRGSRAAGAGELPKQYAVLAGSTVLGRSIEVFAGHRQVDTLSVVIHGDDAAAYAEVIVSASPSARAKLTPPVIGGATRQASVLCGLEALALDVSSRVLIHDAARPFVTAVAIDRVLEGLDRTNGAIAAMPLADTLKRAGMQGRIAETVDRNGLWRAQTPQGFRYQVILEAHRRAASQGLDAFTDDAAIAEWAGLDVLLVEGGESNVKLTTAGDIAMARRLLENGSDVGARETRSGTGFDVHRFAPGSSVWLCGVEIPHTARLEGHSDADVGLHALTDALLGAIGAGDIGMHFPPSDMQWKGAASHVFLRHAADLVAKRGGRIVNVDVTILAEAPRVGPHREAMCRRMAEVLALDVERVSVKATTTEGLGFTGRREGIAAMATANVELPLAGNR